jgi:hypothetical protein
MRGGGVLEGAWVARLTPPDWEMLRRTRDDLAAAGEVEGETVCTSVGYLEVDCDGVTGFGRRIPVSAWPRG